MDSTFGLNKLGYSLFLIMAIGGQGQGVPIAFIIAKSESTESVITGLNQFKASLDDGLGPNESPIRPDTAMTDDINPEQAAINYEV